MSQFASDRNRPENQSLDHSSSPLDGVSGPGADAARAEIQYGSWPLRGELGRHNLVNKLSIEHEVSTFSFSPDGKQLAVGVHDKNLKVVSVSETGVFNEARVLLDQAIGGKGSSAVGAQFSAAGPQVAALSAGATYNESVVQILSMQKRGLFGGNTALARYTADGPERELSCAALDPSGEVLAIGCADGKIKLALAYPTNQDRKISGEPPRIGEFSQELFVRNVVFTPDGKHLLCRTGESQDHRLLVVALSKKEGKFDLSLVLDTPIGDNVTCMSVSPDGRTLAFGRIVTAPRGGQAKESYAVDLYRLDPDLAGLTRTGSIQRADTIRSVSLHPEGRLIAVGGDDGLAETLSLVERAESGEARSISRYKAAGPVTEVKFSPDGSKMAVGAYIEGGNFCEMLIFGKR